VAVSNDDDIYNCKEKLMKLFKTNESSVVVASSRRARQEKLYWFRENW
jgi:hypothetical protein